MPDVPQLDWPLRFTTHRDGTVSFAEVEQDTSAELRASAGVIAATPRGRRIDDEAFGVTPLLHQQGHLDIDRLAAELAQADPRLTDLDLDEVLDLVAPRSRQVDITTS